MNFQQQQ